MHKVHICLSCRQGTEAPQGPAFVEALKAALSDEPVEVVGAECMNACEAPVSMALTAPDKQSYLFAHVRPDGDVADAAGLVRLYLEAKGGVITNAKDAGRLRFCLRGRVPAP